MQQPTILLAQLRQMAQKPAVTFDKLYQKLYNVHLWVMAYQHIAPKPGNMTAGTDGETIDGAGLQLINDLIADLKASRYIPCPVRRVYIPKANGKLRPLGIPSFRDKLLQTVVKLILEAIYEPSFLECSHGFRPAKSCHTALEQVKTTMFGTRWWIEGDIKGFFDHMDHQIMRNILNKRIKDQRFLHLVQQFLKAGYVEDWRYHQTYSGVPQGGNLSPLLSNIYLHELDQAIEQKIQFFKKGKARKKAREYTRINQQAAHAKKRAGQTGEWKRYKALRTQMLRTPSVDHFDPEYRRLMYVRYADDFLLGVIGTYTDAEELKAWVETYLQEHLHLELSREKTLITHAKRRVRFLGYDIQRWNKHRIYRFRTRHGSVTRRTGSYQLRLFMPRDKTVAFAKTFGDTRNWRGKHRPHLLHLSEPEILLIYNAEIRGFLGYYALADNLKFDASKVLKITTESFFRTLANKRQSTLKKVARSLKRGPGQYMVSLVQEGKPIREYELVATTRHLHQETVKYARIDQKPTPMMYQTTTELGKRLLAQMCEWCGTRQGNMEVHHIRKLKDLKGKVAWERKMIARRRKTMVLCGTCHDRLHAGTLKESERKT